MSRIARRRTAPAGARAGQTLTEFALIVAIVAIVAIPAIITLRDMVGGAYVVHASALSAEPGAAAAAPTAVPGASVPTNPAQCKNGGWQTFTPPAGSFRNQGDCQSWVATGGRNGAANP